MINHAVIDHLSIDILIILINMGYTYRYRIYRYIYIYLHTYVDIYIYIHIGYVWICLPPVAGKLVHSTHMAHRPLSWRRFVRVLC